MTPPCGNRAGGLHIPNRLRLPLPIEIDQTNGEKHVIQTGIAIYQVKGNTLSGVYTFATKGTSFADVQRVAFHAAEQSAKNLGVGKKKSGGTGFTA